MQEKQMCKIALYSRHMCTCFLFLASFMFKGWVSLVICAQRSLMSRETGLSKNKMHFLPALLQKSSCRSFPWVFTLSSEPENDAFLQQGGSSVGPSSLSPAPSLPSALEFSSFTDRRRGESESQNLTEREREREREREGEGGGANEF